NIKKLQLIQNFACRIVLGLKKYDHITEGLKSLNWLNVNDRLLVNDLLMVHKLKTGQRSFTFRGAKLYNNLPNEIKQTSDLKKFKAKVCKYLLKFVTFSF
ncbi:unnamed protein product, partial [Porites evermanni]